MKRHVVLIGFNYQPVQTASDKKFWFELVSSLSKELDRITILSIRDHSREFEQHHINNCQVVIEYLRPRFLVTTDAAHQRSKLFRRAGVPVRRLLLMIEKSINTRRIADRLRDTYKEAPFNHIHLMDTFGLGNKPICDVARSLNCPISVSLMSYRGLKPLLNDFYVRKSCNHSNLKIVASSLALKDKLLQLGLSRSNVHHIPWGINQINHLHSTDIDAGKAIREIESDRTLFLWAGYIQQIREKDFFYALEKARIALDKGLIADFYFAFKLSAIKKRFLDLNEPSKGIHIISSSVEEFETLKSAADVFYSPVSNKRTIVGPPLTWIELMGLGVPVLTTDVPGANELVENGISGFTAKDGDDLIDKMFLINDMLAEMKSPCIKKVSGDYNISHIADKYLDLWFNR